MLTTLASQKRAHINVFLSFFSPLLPSLFRSRSLALGPFPDPYFSPPLLLLSSGRAFILFNAHPPFARAVFNFSSVCGHEYISNLSGIGVNINERSIMNERKPRLGVVNQKRLSLGFAVSKSFQIYLAIDTIQIIRVLCVAQQRHHWLHYTSIIQSKALQKCLYIYMHSRYYNFKYPNDTCC